MAIFLIIVLGIILVILLERNKKIVKDDLRIVNKNVLRMNEKLEELKSEFSKGATPITSKKVEPTFTVKPLETSAQRLSNLQADEKPLENRKPIEAEKVPENVPAEPEIIVPVQEEVKVEQPEISVPPVLEEKVVEPVAAPQTKPREEKQVKPVLDYEKIIGENWLNKIGIAILVIGIGFFVKYAIDQNWIKEAGRVAIGMLTGGILIGIAHYLRKSYKSFSSVLIGGGISVFYYTIAIAYHNYHIFSQPVAFAIMVGITIFSTILAVLYDRKELAIIGIIGGFTSPFMISNGTGDYVTFFTYIAILNSGVLALSFFKKWRILLQIALGFSMLYFGGWYVSSGSSSAVKIEWAMVFSTIFFLEFLGASLIYNLLRKKSYNAWEYLQLTSIILFYYGVMIHALGTEDFLIGRTGFTVLIAVFYFVLGLVFTRIKDADRSLGYLFIGKTITAITLAGAFLQNGDFMAVFWSIEAVAIMALSAFMKNAVLRYSTIVLFILGIIALVSEWSAHYYDSILYVGDDYGTLITSVMVILCLLGGYLLLNREKEDEYQTITKKDYRMVLSVVLIGITYFSFLLELTYQLQRLPVQIWANLVLWIYHITSLIILFIGSKSFKSTFAKQLILFGSGVVMLFYFIDGHANNYRILLRYLANHDSSVYYYLHFLLPVGIVGLFYLATRLFKNLTNNSQSLNWFYGIIAIFGCVIATVEMEQIITFGFGNKYELHLIYKHISTEGYTILWGVYSFVLMLIGMRFKNRLLRVLALFMFLITLIKLFVFDIREISDAGKIVAFISLGILLLVISFLYQKLKKIIVGD